MAKYFLHRNNENHGPYDEEQIRQMLSAQQIMGEELICLEGGSEWVAAASLATPPQAPQLQAPLTAAPQNPAFAGGVPPQTMLPQKKGKGGCIAFLLLGLGFLIVIGVIGFYFKSQDDNLRAHGIKQVNKLNLEEDEKLISLALAEHCHLKAANSGTRTSKKSLNTVSETEYWKALQNEMAQELRKLKASGDFKSVEGNQYLYRDLEEDVFYILRFERAGKYQREKYWTKPKNGDSPSETESGNWEMSAGIIVLSPSGGSRQSLKVIFSQQGGFIVKVGASEANYWSLRR